MYKPQTKFFVKDENGNKLSCVEAADRLAHLGYNDQQVRYHVRANGLNTLKALEEFKQSIKTNGNTNKRVIHKTKFGSLTLGQMYEIHPDKANLKKSALSARISRYGAENEKIWEPANSNPVRKTPFPKTKECLLCGLKRAAKFYRGEGNALADCCVDCDGKETKVKPKRKKRAKQIKVGDIIQSRNKKYEVVSVFSRSRDVTCYRVMSDGQVLRRTLIYMPGHKIKSL